MAPGSLAEKECATRYSRGFVRAGGSHYANRLSRALMETLFAESEEEREAYRQLFLEAWREDRHRYEPTAINAGAPKA